MTSDKIKECIIACGNLTENGIENIKTCEGDKRQLIEFINSEIKSREIKSFMEALIVFKIDYKENDENKPLERYTIDELAEKGVVVLK